jgi:IPT/TIG domain-containing protein
MSDASAAPPPVERRRFPRRWRRGRRAALGLLAIVALALAGNLALDRIRPPEISGLSPSPARIGDTITVTGQGFDSTLEGNVVYFGDYSGRLIQARRRRLEVEVPDIGLVAGEEKRVPVKVQVDEDKVSNVVELVVQPPLVPEPGTEPLTQEEAETPPLAVPNPGVASPRASPPPARR